MESPTLNTPFAVWLYGSEARGDASSSSDVDILKVGDGSIPITFHASYAGRKLNFSHYGWDEIGRMAEYGSLFLYHLKAEATVVYESPDAVGRLKTILSSLPHYQRARRDVKAFRQSLLDISAELPNPANLEFELATMAALIRRIGILGSYLLGRPRFDRIGPVKQVIEAWNLPRTLWAEFGDLYKHRLVADGVEHHPNPSSSDVLSLWVDRTQSMLEKLEIQIDGPNTVMQN